MSKEDKQLNIAFVHSGADDAIIKSIANDEEHEYDGEELSKAIDKAKLVQKEVSVKGKNGQTFTRKQWVRAGEEVKQPQDTKKQEDVKGKTTSSSNKSGKQQVAEMLASGKSRTDIMAEFEKQGVTWKKNDHEGINWMRAAMAIQKHLEGSNSSNEESASAPKAESKPDTASKASESKDKTSDAGDKENQTASKTDIKQFTDKVEQYKKDYDEDSYVDAWYEDAYDETQKMYDNEEITMDEMFEMRQKLVKEREKLSSQKQTKSVIGNDYTQLTTEDESGTPEGEAHNTIVGRLKGMGIKHPTKLDVQQAANDLRDRSIKTIISSYNADTISRNLALANAYGSISNASKLTVERVLKDTLERGSGATREQQCDAISKLCGNGSEYEYESFGDNVSVRASDGDGNPIAVTIEPTVKGLFKVEFVYGDGERGKETYDSIDSVKKATESWIKKEEKHKNPSNADPKKASSNIISMIQASNDIN